MTPAQIFWSIFTFYVGIFIWDIYLAYRQYLVHLKNEQRPNSIKQIISEEDYKKARLYKLDKHRFGFMEAIFGKFLSCFILLFNILPWFWNISGEWSRAYIGNGEIVTIGGKYFFFYVWIFLCVIMMTIYPEFIAPLFDKYTILPDSKLKQKIEDLATKVQFPLTKLYVVHGHELGHWKLGHTVFNLIIMEMNTLFLLGVFAYFYQQPKLYEAFGFSVGDKQPVLIGLMLVMQFITLPYNELISFAMSYMSRWMEFDADKFSAKLGYANLLCSALIKLSKDNLSLPIDDWLYSMVNHSHPPIPERIEAMRKYL